MAENLKVTHYNNGDEIPNIIDNSDWENLSTGAYSDYNNQSANSDIYGRLYNWFAVDDNRGICPDGWRVPSDEDIIQLEIFLGMSEEEANSSGNRGSDEGGKMKTTGTIEGGDGLWYAPNEGATNESGFSFLPSGVRGANGDYFYLGHTGYPWSTTEYSSTTAWRRELNKYYSDIQRAYNEKQFGFSIRCIQNGSDYGCTDSEACNFDESASSDDGSCEYSDPGFDCDGNSTGWGCPETDCGLYLEEGYYVCVQLVNFGIDCSICDTEGFCECDCNDCDGNCNDNQFDCGDGTCIYEEWVCDGYVDCCNSSDEDCEDYYNQDDLQVLQDIIDLNGITSESSVIDDDDGDGLWDDGDSVFEPLELGNQYWVNGRLNSFSTISYGIYGSYGYTISYLPESIYMLDNLTYLNVSEAGLVEFPTTFGNLPSLTSLDVWRNNLTDDSFPESMNNLVQLYGISLDGNQLTRFPDFIQYTSNSMAYIYFGYGYWGTGNQIEYFPEWWSDADFISLWLLDFSNNYLKELPESLSVTPLGNLDLAFWNNHLTSLDGVDWLCDYVNNGTVIYLQDNYICDEIPECINEAIIGNQKGCEIVITDNPGAYEFTATIAGGIVLSDGEPIADEGDMFAAFDEVGNVRGLAIQLVPPFGPYEGEIVYEMQLRSNDEGDLLNFQYYDASENLVFDITETYEFVINDILGNVVDPVFYNINTEVEADPSNWYEPEDGSVIIDMGWGVYHSIVINNSILSFMENGYDFYVVDLNGGFDCGSTGEIWLNQITYNQDIDTTYTINVLENIDYCEFGGSVPGFTAGNTIYYKFSSPEGTYYIEPEETTGENIFNSDITIINSFDLSSISTDPNSGRSSQEQSNDSKSKRSESNRDEISIKYEIIKNNESIINDYTDVFYLDKNIEPGNEYCYSVIIKDSNDHLIRTTDVECITIESNVPDYLSGDVTQDGTLNVLDIVMLVDWILSGTPLSELEISIADMTNDGLVNVLDIVALVDTILNP